MEAPVLSMRKLILVLMGYTNGDPKGSQKKCRVTNFPGSWGIQGEKMNQVVGRDDPVVDLDLTGRTKPGDPDLTCGEPGTG